MVFFVFDYNIIKAWSCQFHYLHNRCYVSNEVIAVDQNQNQVKTIIISGIISNPHLNEFVYVLKNQDLETSSGALNLAN